MQVKKLTQDQMLAQAHKQLEKIRHWMQQLEAIANANNIPRSKIRIRERHLVVPKQYTRK